MNADCIPGWNRVGGWIAKYLLCVGVGCVCIQVHMYLCAHAYGGQITTFAVISQVPATVGFCFVFEIGSK